MVNGMFYLSFAVTSVIYKFTMATWVVLIAIFFLPVFLLQQGLLAKDILFANAALLGLCLLHVSRREGTWAVASLWLASACLTLAVMTRQQGAVVLLAALAIILLSTPAAPGASGTMRARLKTAAIFLGAVMIEVVAANAAISVSAKGGPADVMGFGIKVIEFYDISGTTAHDQSVELDLLKNHEVEVEKFPAYVAANYGPDRWDRLGISDGPYAFTFLGQPMSVMTQQWLALIVNHPVAYLRHRLEVFRYFMGFGDRSKCYYNSNIGLAIDATPAPLVDKLHLEPYSPPLARRLSSLEWSWRNSFLYYPTFYLFLSLILLIFCVSHRLSVILLSIQAASLIYIFSYFFVSIACDFRYVYFFIISQCFILFALTLRNPDAVTDEFPCPSLDTDQG